MMTAGGRQRHAYSHRDLRLLLLLAVERSRRQGSRRGRGAATNSAACARLLASSEVGVLLLYLCAPAVFCLVQSEHVLLVYPYSKHLQHSVCDMRRALQKKKIRPHDHTRRILFFFFSFRANTNKHSSTADRPGPAGGVCPSFLSLGRTGGRERERERDRAVAMAPVADKKGLVMCGVLWLVLPLLCCEYKSSRVWYIQCS